MLIMGTSYNVCHFVYPVVCIFFGAFLLWVENVLKNKAHLGVIFVHFVTVNLGQLEKEGSVMHEL